MNNKIMFAGIFAVAAILGYRYTQKAETFDAHVSPYQEETQVNRLGCKRNLWIYQW